MSLATPLRRIERVRYEPRRREVEVVRVDRMSANFVSVTFAGPALSDFASAGFGDHVKFMFDAGGDELEKRDYTPRSFDLARREVTIEFVLHEGGAASEWAARATPGTKAVIGGPKGSMVIAADYVWHLLVGDATALPAIHRRIEELPAGAQAIALIHTPEPSDRREITSAANLDIHWIAGGEDLASHLRSLPLPSSEGFAWCAGESASMARVRDVLVERGHPPETTRVAAYWKAGPGPFEKTLAP